MTRGKKSLLQSPDDFKTFGEYLAYIRETRGYSLRDVDDTISDLIKKKILVPECSVSHGYLRNIETGEVSAPSPFKLKALAHVYRIPYEMLMRKVGYWDEKLAKVARDATFTLMLKEVPQMTAAEKKSLLEFIDFIITKRKKHEKGPKKG
ncbi:MAG: helix-turn-helix transcriptional regulator [Patescibacteria group bacterium]